MRLSRGTPVLLPPCWVISLEQRSDSLSDMIALIVSTAMMYNLPQVTRWHTCWPARTKCQLGDLYMIQTPIKTFSISNCLKSQLHHPSHANAPNYNQSTVPKQSPRSMCIIQNTSRIRRNVNWRMNGISLLISMRQMRGCLRVQRIGSVIHTRMRPHAPNRWFRCFHEPFRI